MEDKSRQRPPKEQLTKRKTADLSKKQRRLQQDKVEAYTFIVTNPQLTQFAHEYSPEFFAAELHRITEIAPTDIFLEFLDKCLSAEIAGRIIDERTTQQLEEQLKDLSDKADNGSLTPNEEVIFRGSLLQARVRRLVGRFPD